MIKKQGRGEENRKNPSRFSLQVLGRRMDSQSALIGCPASQSLRRAMSLVTRESLPVARALVRARSRVASAVEKYPELRKGVNTHNGKLTYKAVAEALNFPFEHIFWF